MKRLFVFGLIVACLRVGFATAAFAVGVAPSALIKESDANAAGLTRAWFGQISINSDFEKVTSATIQDGVLFTTTDSGVLQAFDAEKGTALWTVAVGDEYLLPPAVNSKVVAAVCGDHLHIFDRFTGEKLDETELYSLPSASPAMTEREVYIPTFGEKVFSYPIKPEKKESLAVSSTVANIDAIVKDLNEVAPRMEEKLASFKREYESDFRMVPLDTVIPLTTASFGVSMSQPVVGTQTADLDVVSWLSDQGWLLLSGMARNAGDAPFRLLYKFQARPYFSFLNERRLGNRALIPRVDVASIPFFTPQDVSIQNMAIAPQRRKGGLFIIGSRSGHVFAMNDVTGALRWTYLTETPVSERVSAFGNQAFIPTENGDFFAVSLEEGREIWRASNLVRTVAVSNSRLYAVDHLDRLAILDRETGARVKTLDIGNTQFQIFNAETDRIYLVSSDGLIQCLRETQQVEPLRYREACEKTNARILEELAAEESGRASESDETKVEDSADDEENSEEEDDAFSDSSSSKSDDSSDDEDDVFGSSDDEEDDAFGDAGGDDSDFGSDEDDPF